MFQPVVLNHDNSCERKNDKPQKHDGHRLGHDRLLNGFHRCFIVARACREYTATECGTRSTVIANIAKLTYNSGNIGNIDK
jgi:hypothetical protein